MSRENKLGRRNRNHVQNLNLDGRQDMIGLFVIWGWSHRETMFRSGRTDVGILIDPRWYS
jgi:hypothetical protein